MSMMTEMYYKLAAAVAGADDDKPNEELCEMATQARQASEKLAQAEKTIETLRAGELRLCELLAQVYDHARAGLASLVHEAGADEDALITRLEEIQDMTDDYPAIVANLKTTSSWLANGGVCACGKPITLEDALSAPHVCPDCFHKLMTEGWESESNG